MANRYWLGGNWNNTANWSATNNGAGGASIPTSADSVFWHTIPTSSTYTLDVAANCLDFDFTGATNTPNITGSLAISIFGSLALVSATTWSATNAVVFSATSTGKTITTAGVTIFGGFIFNGVGGGWTLQDNLTLSSGNTVTLTNGSLNTNGKTVTCLSFNSTNANIRTLTLGASSIVCTNFNIGNTTNLTFSGASSLISASTLFAGGGKTFNVVTLTGNCTVSGSNSITSLTIVAGKTISLTSVTTQTVTSLVCNGTTANPSTLQTLTAGSAATIALPAGRYFIRHTSIKDITISGATAVTSIAGTNVSGNTGITFVTKFEMGRIKNDGSFNWYSTTTGTVDKVSG